LTIPLHGGKEFNDDSQIGKALSGLDIGDVGDPYLIRHGDIELTIEGVVDRYLCLATVGARKMPITDLGFDPCHSGQSGDPVWAAGLALVLKIVLQLAVTIDLAAFLPSLLEQSHLSRVGQVRKLL